MKVLILCGGLGSRLAGASDLPKPMVPIGGKPMVWHIMKGFAHWGYRDFVLCLGYRSDLFKQYFLNLSLMLHDVTLDLSTGAPPIVHQQPPEIDWKITLAETGLDALTGARVKRGAAFVPGDDDLFAVTYGDGVTNVEPTVRGYASMAAMFDAEATKYGRLAQRLRGLATTVADTDEL